MLDLIGNILNWLAAGVLFPLLFLPAGILGMHKLNGGALTGSLIWLTKTIASVGLGIVFLRMIPTQALASVPPSFYIWLCVMVASAILMALTGGPAQWAKVIHPFVNAITRIAAKFALWFVIAMALIQFAIVVMRYVFGINFIWMQESIIYLHGAVFLLAGGYALMTDDHVRVDIVYRPASPRFKAWVNLWGTYLLLIPVCLLLLWAASPYIHSSWAAGEGSNESSGVQLLFILKSFIAAFGVLMLTAAFDLLMRSVDVLNGVDPTGERLAGHRVEGQV